MKHRLTRLRVEGMRTLEKIDLDLDGLRVLIGENGSGKSSVLEALELLRRARSSAFLHEYLQIHGGDLALLRHGARTIKIGCRIESSGPSAKWPIEYDIELSSRGVDSERIQLAGSRECPTPLRLVERTGHEALVYEGGLAGAEKLRPMAVGQQTIVPMFGHPAPHPRLLDLQQALEGIEVHVPFDVLPSWVASAHGRLPGVRGAAMLVPSKRVERLGANLASAYHALRNRTSEWETTMDWIRLGLGDWVESIVVEPDGAGGSVGLWIKHAGLDWKLPPSALSDGQLQFLGLVALCRLTEAATIVAFDEPESHLHPHLQDRAAQLFGRLAEQCPVLLATHSRRILDELEDPVGAVRVCAVSGRPSATVIRELDSAALAEWMKEYDGLGQVLNAGYGEFVVRETPDPEPGR